MDDRAGNAGLQADGEELLAALVEAVKGWAWGNVTSMSSSEVEEELLKWLYENGSGGNV